MDFEVKEITETAAEDANRIADVAAGAAVEVAEAAVHPISTIKKQARRLEKKGAPFTRAAEREFERAADDTAETTNEIFSGALPERVALAGIRVIKSQARRQDLIGDVAYTALKLMNDGFEMALRTLNRFENASEPPSRRRSTGGSSRGRRGRSVGTRSARTASSAGRSTRSAGRRAAGQARRTTRRTASAARRSA